MVAGAPESRFKKRANSSKCELSKSYTLRHTTPRGRLAKPSNANKIFPHDKFFFDN